MCLFTPTENRRGFVDFYRKIEQNKNSVLVDLSLQGKILCEINPVDRRILE